MHGLIHVILKELVLEKAGAEAWKAILTACNVQDDTNLLELRQYDDEESFVYVVATAKQLGVDLDTALEVYGVYFVNFVMRHGYKKFMAAMGRTLVEFLQNINELHYNLERDFRHATFASFTVEPEEGSFLLTYHSSRFLPALARGSLRGLAEGFFKVSISIDEVARDEKWVTFRITETGPAPEPDATPATEKGTKEQTPPNRSLLNFHTLHTAMASLPCCRPVQLDTEEMYEETEAPSPGFQGTSGSTRAPDTPRLASTPSSGIFQIATRGVRLHDPRLASGCDDEKELVVDVKAFVHAIHSANEEQRLELARSIIRGVKASRVASTWKTIDEFNEESSNFWEAGARDIDFFSWSADVYEEDHDVRFVSHSWGKPEGWDELMGTSMAYGDGKATELCMVTKDIAAKDFDDYHKWGEVRLWLDKCCIQQEDPQTARMCIELIEEFLQLSGGLIVLFSWSYLTRLWCVYEWACFLVFHQPEDVIMCCDSFYRCATEKKFLHAVRNFQVANCQCHLESDHALLERKIKTYYYGILAFERFLKFTVIALLARSLALRGTRSRLGLKNWAAVAKQCNFCRLSDLLLEVDVEAWQREVQGNGANVLGHDVQTQLKHCCDKWFTEHVHPLFDVVRRDCVRAEVLDSMRSKKVGIFNGHHGMTKVSAAAPRDWQAGAGARLPAIPRGEGAP